MPEDSSGWQVEIRKIVRPEFVPREGENGFEQELGGFRRRLYTGAQVETEKRDLRHRACCKPAPLEEPRRRARVLTVFGRRQCRPCSSSSRALTSSVVAGWSRGAVSDRYQS